jgi:hypothetical protein
MSAPGRRAGVVIALALTLGACAVPPPTPQGFASADARRPAFLPGAPKPGEVAYNEHACGGDHGMLEELNDNDRGRLHIGPPQMSICP